MPRRPEIGNIQLYPNRPLRDSDKNGYVLKFYCPIKRKRIRRNCGTRDRREARRILRECQQRLHDGEYVASGGAITAEHAQRMPVPQTGNSPSGGSPVSWQECSRRYREHKASRISDDSLKDAMMRVGVAERIFEGYREDRGLPEGLAVAEFMTLEMMDYLQDRLLAGDESRLDVRSPNTVNSMVAGVMAFVRFCYRRGWIERIPDVERIDADEVMKGRPVSGEEFERMLAATPRVVGDEPAASWQFALRVLWESGFRVGDLMDFVWDDDRHICPVWPDRASVHPTLLVPSTQKNRRFQEIPMLPGLEELLLQIPKSQRTGWVVDPLPMRYEIRSDSLFIRPTREDLRSLASSYSNRSIARACNVTDTTVRKWLAEADIARRREFQRSTGDIPQKEMAPIRRRAERRKSRSAQRSKGRLTKDRVSRIISMIGEEAGVVVRQEDKRTSQKLKYASAHDLRRGCAQRLINLGVSAETLKVVLRHRDFATTEKFYGAMRSAQSAATELRARLSPSPDSAALVGGLMGGMKEAPQFSAEELQKLKSLLNSL